MTNSRLSIFAQSLIERIQASTSGSGQGIHVTEEPKETTVVLGHGNDTREVNLIQVLICVNPWRFQDCTAQNFFHITVENQPTLAPQKATRHRIFIFDVLSSVEKVHVSRSVAQLRLDPEYWRTLRFSRDQPLIICAECLGDSTCRFLLEPSEDGKQWHICIAHVEDSPRVYSWFSDHEALEDLPSAIARAYNEY